MARKEIKTAQAFTGRTVNRIVSILLYIFVASCTVFIGVKLINRSIDSNFYADFLAEWEITCKKSTSAGVKWPAYKNSEKKQYMQQYVDVCRRSGINVPESNTNINFIYEINKIGIPKQPVFVLCLPSKIVIYGLSAATIERIDLFVDKQAGFAAGNFTAFPDKKNSFTGILRL